MPVRVSRPRMVRPRTGALLAALLTTPALTLTGLPVTAATTSVPASEASSVNPAPTVTPKTEASEPTYSYADAEREQVYVRTDDFDGDGEGDLVAVSIIRPAQAEAGGTTFPVIMDASPYYSCCGRGAEEELKSYAGDASPRRFPLYYDNYFVPRGYAVVQVDLPGTSRSTGCVDIGADSDVLSVVDVIEWLGGAGEAVDADGDPVDLPTEWSNGKVGMIGKSYDGTIANAVAATGTPGLETIVPIGAISSWYDYGRSQGIPYSLNYPAVLADIVDTDRRPLGGSNRIDCSARLQQLRRDDADGTGAYTDFWQLRDYRAGTLGNASRVRASVFAVHGLADVNVKTVHIGRWWRALQRHGVERKLWLSRSGHDDPFDFRRGAWVRTLHAWFDAELKGLDSGVHDQPRVSVQLSRTRWVQGDRWPVVDRGARLGLRPGALVRGRSARTGVGFVNAPDQSEAQAIRPGRNRHRLLFLSGPLKSGVRISGEPRLRLRIRPGQRVGQVGVALVDYGTARRVRESGLAAGVGESCWGESTGFDDACYATWRQRDVRRPLAVLARGWARLQPGRMQRVTVDLAYNDVRVARGHRLGVVVVAANGGWTLTLDRSASRYRVRLGRSWLRLPAVGGKPEFGPTSDSLPSRPIPPGTLPEPPSELIPRG